MNLNKFLAGVALAAILASCSGKNEDKPTPKTPGTLTSLALLASDNSDLTEDIVISDITSSAPMIVRIEGGGNGKTLVATVTAGENDVITDGAGSVITNGKITFDASYALDIIVRNTESKLSTAYELKVGKILKTVVTKIASYAEKNAEYGMAQYFRMAINPADGLPYIAYLRKTTVDGVQEKMNLASVVKLNPTTNKLEFVGDPGFPSDATKEVSSPIFIGFDKNNTPEVLYYAGEVEKTLSAKKYIGGSWQNLGTPGFGEVVTDSFGISDLYKNPVSGELGVFLTNNIKSDANYRCHVNFEYDGSEWVMKHDILPGLPKLSGTTTNAFFCAGAVNTTSAAYVITNINGGGYSVFKNTDGNNWKVVVDNFIPDGEEKGLASPTIRLDKDGNLYAAVSINSTGTVQAYKVDEANGTFIPYGNTFEAANTDNPVMAINPVTNEFFAAKVDKESSKIKWTVLDPETKQWSSFNTIPDGIGTVPYPRTKPMCQVVFNASGVGYLAYYLQTKVEGEGTATTIELCKIATEDDILPE